MKNCRGKIQGKKPYGVSSPLLPPQLVRPRVKYHMTVSACFCMCASLREKKIISFHAFSLRTQGIFFTFLLFKFNCGVLMTNIEEI